MLTQQAIDELKAINRMKTGRELPDYEAWEMGSRLLRVFSVLLRVPDQTRNDNKHNSSK